ncbi:MAG: SPASM domain-containing protein [Armatimonadetes bacterium]|nr:SPASM domain-containing protein [Armatimonadota bacterium]NIM24867.1 SPASM domain-containing protein [Armatimonadota bacterium]NIM68757.1 SPASM domain-containing protein [Armatimonadota bacterium]NIM77018.1 SPASM domain-containing protein [Armatimonadota bacterium]NIO98806.1 SPASM domain-containing protein [Armatimonadota bacterium]
MSVAGRNFAFDVGTSAGFQLDDLASEVLQTFAKLPREAALERLSNRGPEVDETVREVQSLLLGGFFQPDVAATDPPALTPEDPRELHLAITYRCTLRCRYCYAHPQEAGGRDVETDMSEKVIDAAFEWAANHFAKDANKLNVWTGATGESLLSPHALERVQQQAERYAAAMNKSITTVVHTTNLTLADKPEIRSCLADKDSWWRVSIDGPQHINDAMRRFPDGKGSYEVVASALSDLWTNPDLPDRYTGAATITGEHPNVTDIFLHLHKMGFRCIRMRPIRMRHNESFAINERTIGAIKQGYSDFVEFLLQQDDDTLLGYLKPIWHYQDYFGRFMLRALSPQKGLYRCGAGKWIAGVDTNGDIYPCGPMIGILESRMGSVFTGVSEEGQRLYREDLLVTRKPVCKECWARYLCGGGCYVSAFLVNQRADLPDPYDCELMQHLIELAIYMGARLRHERSSILPELDSQPKN